MKLTDLSIKALCVPTGQRTFFDDSLTGFGVRVSTKAKTFVLVAGEPRRWRKIGRYPIVSLSQAREKAKRILAGIQLGEPQTSLTFSEAFKEYEERHLIRIRKTTAYEQARILRVRFEPRLGDRRLEDLTARDVAPIVDAVPTVYSARAAFCGARMFFNWCVRQDYLARSPISRLSPRKRPEARDRVLTDSELVRVWNASSEGVYGAIVRLLILTGQRRAQIAGLRPEFITGDILTWPPDMMKGNRKHFVPLSPMVAGLLPTILENSPFQQWSPAKLKLDKAVGFSDWKLHDLRRTFATKLAEMGIAPHIIERIIAHQTGVISGVTAIYNRASYVPEMKSALLVFEEKLQTLLSNTEGADGHDSVSRDGSFPLAAAGSLA